MSPQELTDLSVIVARAKSGGWTSNQSAMLGFFADLAARQHLSEFAQGFAIVAEGLPEAAPFLFDILPLVVAANYPPFETVDLVSLETHVPCWPEVLSDALFDPNHFADAVGAVLAAL